MPINPDISTTPQLTFTVEYCIIIYILYIRVIDMRKTAKIMAILTAFIILISTFVLPANAASVNYSASSVSGTKGDTVTVSVKLSSGVELWGANVMLGYNSSELQYVSSSNGSLVTNGKPYHDGDSVNFAGSLDTSKSKNGGTVFTVKFKVLKNSGTSTLTVIAGTGKDNCDYDGNEVKATTTNGKVTITVPVTSIKLNKSSVTLKKGETSQLTATVSPDNATNKTVTYSSSNTKVAKVSSSGKITAVGGGTATITAKAGGKTATCKVTVNVAQTGITASGNTSKTVEMGGTLKLKVSKVPADATDDYSVSWSVADTNIATVSSNGTVKGVALGTTTVTAKSNGWTVTYKITVTEPVTENSTEEPSSEDDTSATEEPSSEDKSSTTEPTVAVEPDTTEPATEKKDFWESIKNEIYNQNNMISKPRYYLTMVVVAVATALVSIAVTYFVTKGYYKTKSKKNDLEE